MAARQDAVPHGWGEVSHVTRGGDAQSALTQRYACTPKVRSVTRFSSRVFRSRELVTAFVCVCVCFVFGRV